VAGREAARDGAIVTFGIVPTAPATGYGYIEAGAVIAGDVRKVERFVEKPNATRALEYLTKGFLWNSGNFLFAPPRVIEEYQATDPESVATVERAVQLAGLDLGVPTLDREAFVTAKKIAFDFAVMEKTRHAAVVAGDFGWSDIGSWDALWEIAPHDSRGNATSGDVLLTDTDGTYVSAGEQLVATIGVKDLIVVATHDAVLVADRHRSADVKSLVDRLKKDARPEASEHARVYRPWGWYQSLVSKDGFQVKRIVVYPGGKLSLQKHKHRAEHWVIVRGVARVTIAQDVQDLGANQSVYIPLGAVHRLENPGEIDLEVIEVQTGSYLGEDDIIRLEDVYARV
jgi:mannose-1-phosphate guanylyltransferase/mannose-6-phosphate isomerase